MTTIINIPGNENIKDSRDNINANFENLNNDKLESGDIAGKQDILAEGPFVDGDKTKLDGIEANAEVNNISDVNATDLTDGGDSTLHFHSSDRDRANHTGTQDISTINNLQTELDGKQETLVSGTNIKTINGATVLGSGNLDVATGSGGYAGDLYFSDVTSTINGAYKQLSYTPDVLATNPTIVCNNGETAGQVYLFELPINTTIIDAGKWLANFYASVSSNNGDTRIRYETFVREDGTGTETTLFSSTSPQLTTTAEYIEWETVQAIFNVNPTSRYGIRVFASTTANQNRTVTYTVGDGNASYTNTPLATRHSQLRARDQADQHPIGAITGLQNALDGKQNILSEGAFIDGDKTKLDGIETGAEVNTINSDPTGVTGADQVTNAMSLTQAEYDAITPNSSTFYIITI